MAFSRIAVIIFALSCFVATISSTTNPSLLTLMEKQHQLRFPLDQDTLNLALSAGLVTNQPDFDKKSPFVVTPFGVFARECVLGVDGGSRVSELQNGDLLVENRANGTSWVYEAQSKHKCRERYEPKNLPPVQRRLAKKNNISAPLWQDGWLDNAWGSDSNEYGFFSSNYVVPQTPPDGSATLFWFIGLESSTSDLTILQPVLTWNNLVGGWSFASWYCCPSGTPNYGTNIITGFGPGATLYGEMRADNPTTGSDFVVSSCSSSTDCTVLACPAQGRTWGTADVTLETYRITSCSMFAPGTMTFGNMQMRDISGSSLNPSWSGATGPTECSGQLSVVNSQTITITHQNS